MQMSTNRHTRIQKRGHIHIYVYVNGYICIYETRECIQNILNQIFVSMWKENVYRFKLRRAKTTLSYIKDPEGGTLIRWSQKVR